MVAGLFGMFFLGSLYMERVLGYGPLEIGLAFLPVALAIDPLARSSERLVMRFGARATLIPGLALIASGLALFTAIPVQSDYVSDLLSSLVMVGVGAGLSFLALMNLAMSGATPEDSGLASGLVNTTLQAGGALGLAVLATLSATRTEGLVVDGAAQASALTDGYQLAWTIGVGLLLAAVGIAVAVLRPAPAAAPAHALESEPEPEPAYSEAA